MGLFNIESTQKKKEILQNIIVINQTFVHIGYLLDEGKTKYPQINTHIERIEPNVERVRSLVESMNDFQLLNFNVPWIDGRQIGIMMWFASFQHVLNGISSRMMSSI
jgi:hypothetical protein